MSSTNPDTTRHCSVTSTLNVFFLMCINHREIAGMNASISRNQTSPHRRGVPSARQRWCIRYLHTICSVLCKDLARCSHTRMLTFYCIQHLLSRTNMPLCVQQSTFSFSRTARIHTHTHTHTHTHARARSFCCVDDRCMTKN